MSHPRQRTPSNEIEKALVGAAFTALLTAVWRHRRIRLNRERRDVVDLRGRSTVPSS